MDSRTKVGRVNSPVLGSCEFRPRVSHLEELDFFREKKRVFQDELHPSPEKNKQNMDTLKWRRHIWKDITC